MKARRALLALLLLCPLAELPGTGFDSLRLPLALAAGAALLAFGPAPRPGRGGAALLAVLAAQGLSLAATSDLDAGLRALLATAAGFGAWAAAGATLDAVPILSALAGLLLAAAVVQVARHTEAASLLGNSNYAGAFAAMLMPILAAGGRVGWSGAGAAGALLAVSASRGGLVGAAVGIATASAILWRSGRRREALAGAAILLTAASLGVAARPRQYFSAERLETASVRLEVWKGSLRLAADRPWLGAGAGGFGAAFPPYRSEAEARYSQREAGRGFPEVEDAHSSWMQALAEGGLPGFLAWLALAVVTARLAWRAGPEQAGWAGAATAFLAAGLFNTLSAHVSHVVLFGIALGRLEGATSTAPRPAGWIVGALLGLGALWTSIRIPSDLAYHRALVLEDPAAREAAVRRAEGWRARYQLGVELDRQGRHAEAVEAYRGVLRDRPSHGGALNNLAVALLRAGRPRAEAEAALARALEVAPHYYMTHFNLGLLRLQDGRPAEARTQFEKAAGLNVSHGASRYGVGETYLAAGDVPGALPSLRAARATGFDVGAALRRDHPATAGDPRLAEFQR